MKTVYTIALCLSLLSFAPAHAEYEQTFNIVAAVPVKIYRYRSASPYAEDYVQTQEGPSFRLQCWSATFSSASYLKVSTSLASLYDDQTAAHYFVNYSDMPTCTSTVQAITAFPNTAAIKLVGQRQVEIVMKPKQDPK